MTQAAPDEPIDEDDVFYQVTDSDRGRVYGLGSQVSSSSVRGASSSTQSQEVIRLNDEITSLRAQQQKQEDTIARLLAFLRQTDMGAAFFGDPGASTSQGPAPQAPPPQASATQAPVHLSHDGNGEYDGAFDDVMQDNFPST